MRQGITALRYLMSSIAISLAFSLVGFAQQAAGGAPQTPPKLADYPAARAEGLAREWTRARDYTKEFLDAMPEDGYAFKPSPDIRSFAEQMLHLAGGNYGIGSRATGATNAMVGKNLEKDEAKTKAAVTKAVLDSYDFVIASVKGLTDTKLDERVPVAGMNRPRSVVLAAAFEHQTHHRGQTVIYLRLKGVQPPSEKLF
ncbi:MAG: DinB family protein [Acidobacteriota bacterium]